MIHLLQCDSEHCNEFATHRQVSAQLYQYKYGHGSQIWAVLPYLRRFSVVINVK
jgi:hypothetical protein